MTERSSIFDMIGPVMIGPSSSHTAGVARIGRVARLILGAEPTEAAITFFNSFATTYEGHGSDRAVVAGLLGYSPDDRRLRDALEIARQKGVQLRWRALNSAPKLHPNTLLIEAKAGERQVSVMGVSRGGGLITVVEIDGFHANIVGQSHLLLVLADDIPGSIALITTPIAQDGCNVATLIVTRRARQKDAKLIFELDDPISPETLEHLRGLHWVKEVVYIAKEELEAGTDTQEA